ncbi:EF-hand domain-containing protein 1 [Monoraphidium neglectum]|uniref:EF-hand domain-containing protein 1 n=1 Tax=Monoraphidium neglectum TaxID=145388 RepID=A0A0D2JH69_9CHLO|nr:EF-hand domain-containing protein 1 [Monoraphidium neglectum]KIY98702.1 EF-hand domain-containing protein 1 [Monoraphidium neglectum]|eukprot:XP_013897722.1 EF-hand domain-containing protein 1 [Monoraphidium neglectum]
MAFGEPRAASAIGETLPKWVENDRKVLRFWGYFQESVTESNIENHRMRRVALHYYLADDSLQVAEPKQDNSGIPQGIFVRRHQVPRGDGSGATIVPADLAVGATIDVYGRTFFLVDCDQFTRAWFRENLQLEQADAQGYPSDQVDAYRTKFGLTSTGPSKKSNDLATFVEARLGKPSHLLEGDKLRQFIANNGKVLRFWCVWDDRQGMYGDRRPYVLHFYLEDDTVEINEVHERNSGRDPFPIFVKRGPLPRAKPRGVTLTGRFPKSMCYRPEDLRIGGVINVHGRAFLVYGCDAATREWYKVRAQDAWSSAPPGHRVLTTPLLGLLPR